MNYLRQPHLQQLKYSFHDLLLHNSRNNSLRFSHCVKELMISNELFDLIK